MTITEQLETKLVTHALTGWKPSFDATLFVGKVVWRQLCWEQKASKGDTSVRWIAGVRVTRGSDYHGPLISGPSGRGVMLKDYLGWRESGSPEPYLFGTADLGPIESAFHCNKRKRKQQKQMEECP